MERVCRLIRAPGARRAIESAAPTQVATEVSQDVEMRNMTTPADDIDAYPGTTKARILDRWLDQIVKASGSEFAFFTILAALLAWAFLGIRFGQTTDWKVGISDGQAIVNLVFDSFLMRQQFNEHDETLAVSCYLRSRTFSHKRMLKHLVECGKYKKVDPKHFHQLKKTEFASDLPTENLLGRICTTVSDLLGHFATVIGFWVCIFIWIGFGPYCGWSSNWWFYINSSTSALMVFMLAFLANIRERHHNYSTKCLRLIYAADAALELRLRTVTGDTVPNPAVSIPAPKVSKIQRGINFYADLVGTLLGIIILFIVLGIWVVLGPVMSFGSNWGLLIGTYAGLVGMNDGFVLRNVYNKIELYEDTQFEQQDLDDMEILALIGVTELGEERVVDKSLSCRISVKMGNWCSHEWTVILGVLTVLGLVIGASAKRWTLIGQLVCNVPPSIIESFFTMILITGHNIGDARRRVNLHNIYTRRLKLISCLETLAEVPEVAGISIGEDLGR